MLFQCFSWHGNGIFCWFYFFFFFASVRNKCSQSVLVGLPGQWTWSWRLRSKCWETQRGNMRTCCDWPEHWPTTSTTWCRRSTLWVTPSPTSVRNLQNYGWGSNDLGTRRNNVGLLKSSGFYFYNPFLCCFVQDEFGYNAETQKLLCKNGETLLGAVNFFVSSINTLVNKTMEDTLMTIKMFESAR